MKGFYKEEEDISIFNWGDLVFKFLGDFFEFWNLSLIAYFRFSSAQ